MFSSSKVTLHFCKKLGSLICINRRNAQKCSKKQIAKGPPWRILFFGTDNFSLQSLKSLCAKLISIDPRRTGTLISSLGIVTKKHSAVHNFGETEKLQLYCWPVKPSQVQSHYDIGMVVSFGNLIPKSLIESLPLGCINVHASLLPRWRGAAPIIHAILAGDNETGVTIMRIHPHKFDVGEIVRQYRISIGKNETAEELEKRLAVYGSDLLMECLRDLPKCVHMAVPQPQYGITYAPKVDPSISNVIWEISSAQYIYNLYRGVSHLYHLKTSWHGQVVKLRSLYLDPKNRELFSEGSSLEGYDSQKSALDFLLNSNVKKCGPILAEKTISDAGVCSYDKERRSLRVSCADGHEVLISRIQVANKVMDARDFYNGFMTKKTKSEWKFISITK